MTTHNKKFENFKKRLAVIIKEDFIESWLQKPNADFIHRLRSIGNKIEFLEKHNWKLSK